MNMQVLGEPYSMGQQTEIILLRMVQEALNNALKHAPGTPITLLLDYRPDELSLRIIDQGPGFSMNDVSAKSLAGAGQGLHNLRRRATLLGGTCSWQAAYEDTSVRQGTQVIIVIPRTNPVDDTPLMEHVTKQRIVTA
jgi:signal transduction histidine kinase